MRALLIKDHPFAEAASRQLAEGSLSLLVDIADDVTAAGFPCDERDVAEVLMDRQTVAA